jgi:hypothetical protein
MQELPVAAFIATDAVRRQFDPAAPPEPDPPHRVRRSVRAVRSATAAALYRTARAIAPPPDCAPAR